MNKSHKDKQNEQILRDEISLVYYVIKEIDYESTTSLQGETA